MGPGRKFFCAGLLLACVLGGPAAADTDPAVPGPGEQGETVADDATHLEAFPFPGVRYMDAVRLHFQSRFVPDAGLGPAHASLYRPEARGRLTVPVSDRAMIRLTALGGMARYELRGPDQFLGDSVDLYRTRLAVQGAYRLNEEGAGFWWDDERWSLLAAVRGGSDFESGAIDDGTSLGGGLALGFEIPGRLRVAAGFEVASSPRESGIDWQPTGFLRWNVTDRFTVRNRGLGLQLEYRLNPRLELFASAFRDGDRYALDTMAPVPGTATTTDDLILRDRMFLTGLGFEWKISKVVRVNSELGAVAWRRFKVESDDWGTLISWRGDPAAYFEVRFEVRP